MQEKNAPSNIPRANPQAFFLNAIERYQKHCKYNAFFEYGQQKKNALSSGNE